MGWKVSCAYLVYCVSLMLFGMSLVMHVRCATYRVRLAMDHVEGLNFASSDSTRLHQSAFIQGRELLYS